MLARLRTSSETGEELSLSGGEGARAEGWLLQVAKRPQGGGEEDRVASIGSMYSLQDYRKMTQHGSRHQEALAPGPSLATCLAERVAGPKPPEPRAPPSRTTALPTRSRENREISRYKPSSISRVSPRTNMAVHRNQYFGI